MAFVLSGVSYSLYSTSSNASNSYVLSFLSSQVDESRNESKENDTIDDIGSSPLKSVGEILLDSVVLLNPDVLADGRFAEVSAIQSTDRLRGVLNKSASAVHEEYCPKSKRKVKTGMSEFSRRLLSPSIWLSHTVFVGNHGKEYSIQNQEKVPCDQKRGSVQAGGDEASGGVQQPSAGEHVPEQAVG